MPSIEELLNSGGSAAPKANPEPQAAVTEQPAPPEPEAELEAQAAPEPATGEPEPSAPAAPPAAATQEEPLDKRVAAFQRKAEDETRKRQDYEKQLAESKRQIDEQAAYIRQVQEWVQAQQQAKEQPEIDLLDPQVAQRFIESQVQPKLFETRVLISQEMYRASKPDYDEIEQIFAAQCDHDPSLRAKLLAHPVPAKFAYEEGKKIKLMQELSDPEAYKAKMREEILAELQAQNGQQQPPASPVQTPRPTPPQPPTSLAGVPSASRDPVKHPWKGPTPLDLLLN